VKYLLDTNTCIAAMRNHALVVRRLSALAPSDCAVSTITAYELFTGVEKCADPARERLKIERLLNAVCQLPFDSAAAAEAARVRGTLEALGQPIGPYDMLLAGHACLWNSFWRRATPRNLFALAGCRWRIGKPSRYVERAAHEQAAQDTP
jgi:tRNA(fMet)-specific endonuclease VapC